MGTDTDYSGRPVTRPEYTDKPPSRLPRRRGLMIRYTRDGIRVTKTAAGWYTVDENLELGERVDDPKFDWS